MHGFKSSKALSCSSTTFTHKEKKSVLATETHIHPLKPDQRFLPIVKLKPSMLKVALRHFLNPAFLELSSDMFSSWLGPSARGEKDSSGGKACSERGRQRSESIISEGSHKVDISCRELIPSVKIPLELIIQPVSLLPAFLTLKRINMLLSLSLPLPLTLWPFPLLNCAWLLALSLSFTVTLTHPIYLER